MAGIAHVITSDSASGAQIIDGSLKFDQGKTQHLTRTPSTEGNKRTWTWSGWVKPAADALGDASGSSLFAAYSDSNYRDVLRFGGTSTDAIDFQHRRNGTNYGGYTDAKLRDYGGSGWYHVVLAWNDGATIYVNGVEQSLSAAAGGLTDANNGQINNDGKVHYIGARSSSGSAELGWDGQMSQVYFVDGQELGPENFGFTDPLTNTWRPKKFDIRAENNVNDGTTWSNGIDAARSGDEATKGFDGLSSTNAAVNDTDMAWTVSLTGVSSMQIQCRSSNTTGTETLTVSGTGIDDLVIPATEIAELKTITVTSPNVSNLTITTSNSGSIAPGIARVFVNGYILKDATVDNSFYLPFDGNSPIGQDQSGNGNDWTPVNFGGSVELDSPLVTGARPVLNTTQGGTQAGVGVFGSRENVGYAVTVYDDGGGNKYYIDGVKQDTVTGLIRGATYTFDTSDSTVSSHPFRFSTTTQEGGGSATLYSNGVAAITGAATTITVPYDAPETLYYYCTSHSGMGADITGITTNEKLADQYASSLVLALPLVGSSADVCASIACTASTISVTSNGNAAASSEQSNFYNGSFEFDGTGDYLSMSESDFTNISSSDAFTVETFVYLNDLDAYSTVFASSNGSFSTGGFKLEINNSKVRVQADSLDLNSGMTLSTKRWYHLAFSRTSDGKAYSFVDGILDNSATGKTFEVTWPVSVRIGGKANDTEYLNGFVQDFRYYKGVAKYTSNFVVPSTSPDILPVTPSGVSGSSKLAKITDGAVSFDGSGDYLALDNSSDFSFGSGDFTIEAYAYWNTISGLGSILGVWESDNSRRTFLIQHSGSGTLSALLSSDGGAGGSIKQCDATSALAAKRWYHVAFTRSGNNIRLFLDGKLQSTTDVTGFSVYNNTTDKLIVGGFKNDGSGDPMNGFVSNVRIIKGTALYTSRFTPPAAPLTDVTNTKLLCCQSNTLAGAAAVTPVTGNTGYTGTSQSITLNQSNLDAGTVANVVDGSTSTSADLRGAGSFVELIFPQQQNGTLQINVDNGNDVDDDDIRVFIDGVEGTAFDVSSQSWYTIHTGNFTTVKLEHQGSTTGYIYGFRIGTGGDTIISKSVAPVGDAAATNFNPFNTDIHTVRGQETGYCTYSPLDKAASHTVSEGNLKVTCVNDANALTRGTIATPVDSGKWYWENELTLSVGAGFGAVRTDNSFDVALWTPSSGYGYYSEGPSYTRKISGGTQISYGDSFVVGDTIGVALDLDNSEITFYKNGVSQGVAFSSLESGSYAPAFSSGTNSGTAACKSNFGQKPFKFPPPDGFQPLNTANVRPTTVISRPDQYVGVATYTGSGNTSQDIIFGFKPDFAWTKSRSTAENHGLFDSVRGLPKFLRSDSTDDEYTLAAGTPVSFISNGINFTNGSGEINESGQNYVAWAWKAGGNKNTFNIDDVGYASAAAAGLDGGTIALTGASVGTKQGFSIIGYTGTDNTSDTFSHGLSQKPDFAIFKNRSQDGDDWIVYHSSLGATKRLKLNSSNEFDSQTSQFNDTEPTSSLFTIGTYDNINKLNNNYVSYIWHDVPGLQKFGSYEGNDADGSGPFVELGFRPAVILLKNADASQDWILIDGTRDAVNPSYKWVEPSDTTVENSTSTNNSIDILSNGFTPRGASSTNDATNGPSQTIIYAAWAEAPSIDLYGGGANAR